MPTGETLKRPKPAKSGSKMLLDLSHVVEHGLVTYKGLPAPVITDHMTREESRKHYGANTEFQIGKIEMVANTGTYLDSPFHRFARGRTFLNCPCRCWRIWRESVLRPSPAAQLAHTNLRVWSSRAKRSWCIPAGRATGERRPILRDIPS